MTLLGGLMVGLGPRHDTAMESVICESHRSVGVNEPQNFASASLPKSDLDELVCLAPAPFEPLP